MGAFTEWYGWRDRTVLDRDGEKIGKLDEVYLDRETNEPNGRPSPRTALRLLQSRRRSRGLTGERTTEENDANGSHDKPA